ncbi:MAG: hypothetical protein HY074_01060, partial [Deltaproteobacteria bacterium]|nr:hypothetical protein [Deltaproteobacteria bacterium]
VGIDPNSKLSELASELNFKKILRQLKDTPSFSKYKYSFAAVALGCTDTCIEGRASTLPCAKADGAKAPMGVEDMLSTGERSKGKTRADLVADTTQTMTAQFTARTADLHATNDPTDAQAPDRCSDSDYDKSRGAVNFDLTDAKLVATTRYLTERMGVNMSEWSMAASNGEFSYASGIDGIDRVYQLYLLEQLKNPDPGLPKLGSYLKINKSEAGEVPGRVGVDFTGTAADKARLCESLKERSLKAFGGEAGKCPDPGGQPVPKQTEEDIEKARNATFGL